MEIARQNGKLRGKQPVLKPAQDRETRRMHDSGDYAITEIAGRSPRSSRLALTCAYGILFQSRPQVKRGQSTRR
jgi:hypothetical protein